MSEPDAALKPWSLRPSATRLAGACLSEVAGLLLLGVGYTISSTLFITFSVLFQIIAGQAFLDEARARWNTRAPAKEE